MKISFKLINFSFAVFLQILKSGDGRHLNLGDFGEKPPVGSADLDHFLNFGGSLEQGFWEDPTWSSWMTYAIFHDKVVIKTALSEYHYIIFKDGRVFYEGPYMGLLSQNLLPEILLNHRFTGFELVEATNYSGILKGYWDLRNKGAVSQRYKGWNHPFCLKEKPGVAPRWHEALDR